MDKLSDTVEKGKYRFLDLSVLFRCQNYLCLMADVHSKEIRSYKTFPLFIQNKVHKWQATKERNSSKRRLSNIYLLIGYFLISLW